MKNNNVVLRHKMFPFVVIYNDPQENWDGIVKDRIIEEIKKDGFDNFTTIVTSEQREEEDKK
tara:strand:+ start:352 stop:537 length:186 start_codon:yes stop_codon:yes gene_type:complete